MGIYDRGYYRDDESPTVWGGLFTGIGQSAVTLLIVLNVAVYVVDLFTTGPRGESTGGLMAWLQLRGDTLFRPWQAWQLLTYGFAHASLSSPAGIWHILFNMLGLYMFGRPVEMRYGRGEFLRFYLSAIVVSGLCWLVGVTLTGNTAHVAVGASGGVVAVVMLFVFNFPRQQVLLFGLIPMEARYLGLIFVLLEVLNSLNPHTTIGWQAHLGGMAWAALYYKFQWNFAFLANRRWLRGRPRVRIHRDPNEQLQIEADRLLAKIHAEGEASLTRRERKTLERYSQLMREQRQASQR